MSRINNSPRYFILSVDTEEEWDWGGPFPDRNWRIDNTKLIPEFHETVRSLGVKPTYFVDYAVLQDVGLCTNLKVWQDTQQCEVGAHLHPWCNPPFYTEKTNEEQSHVVNLPLSHVEEKLVALTEFIERAVGKKPVSFRTGRWGINGEILNLVKQHGYKIDSSVCPYYKTPYFSCDGAEPKPYWPSYDQILSYGDQRDILEVPVTAGFNRKNFGYWAFVHRAMEQNIFRKMKAVGIAWHLKLLRKLYLSPELSTLADMKQLVDATVRSDYPVIHMYFHSSTLLPNKNNFVADEAEKEKFINSILSLIQYCSSRYNLEFCTLKDLLDKKVELAL